MAAQISIILPVYNAEKYILAAIQSIQNQTFTDWELIIINDGSTDQSLNKIENITQSNIKIHSLKTHQGLTAALNYGIQQASGKYLARMDADDLMHHHRLQAQFDFMQKNPDIDLCSTYMMTFSQESNLKSLDKKPQFNFSWQKNKDSKLLKCPLKDNQIKTTLLFYDPIFHPTVMWRQSWQKRNKVFYDQDFSPAEDYELWTRILPFTNFTCLPEALHFYRLHPEQVTRTAIIAQKKQTVLIRDSYQDGFLQGKSSFMRLIVKSDLPKKIKILTIEHCLL